MKTKTPKKLRSQRKQVPAQRRIPRGNKNISKRITPLLELTRTMESYPEIKDLDHLTVVAEHWLTDMQFFKEEIQFLHNLISKYFVWLTEDENIKSTKEIAKELSELEKQRIGIEQKVHQHIHNYRNLFENPFSQDRTHFEQQHKQLEGDLTGFVKVFRLVKQKTFSLTEIVIQSEKVKHLLSNQIESEN